MCRSKAKENLNDSPESCNHDSQNGPLARPMVCGRCYSYGVPCSKSKQWTHRMGHHKHKRVVVAARSNETCTMTSPVSKKQQEAATRNEIAKRRQLHDEPESDSSSGSEVNYNITSSDESPIRTTRANSKAQEDVATATSPPQSNEGSDEAESDDDNPSADNTDKGNDDVEESGDDDTNAEESGDKDSAVEESNE
ncbi:hypothetical protein HAX54_051452 [Datura stramonium]|uniref:C2H2-type domain-containing protein n=1 Tax=Datura stramonium TaxID=4076 RepID=A0ABS8WQ61_DATST|nr:hypothetical protein [Datura stramonium]